MEVVDKSSDTHRGRRARHRFSDVPDHPVLLRIGHDSPRGPRRLVSHNCLNSESNPWSTCTPLCVISIRTGFTPALPPPPPTFSQYARDGFYEGTLFHRVIPQFHDPGAAASNRHGPRNRPARRSATKLTTVLKNQVGTIAIGPHLRSPFRHRAILINVKDNDFLDHRAPTGQGWATAVFGRVVKAWPWFKPSPRTHHQPAGHQDVPVVTCDHQSRNHRRVSGMVTLFVSDLHLDPARPCYRGCFLNFWNSGPGRPMPCTSWRSCSRRGSAMTTKRNRGGPWPLPCGP